MQPYDGSGYGSSTYWTWQMQSIAKHNGEICQCWENAMPKLSFIPEPFALRISCAVKTSLCKDSFPETEKDLKKIFDNLYKV